MFTVAILSLLAWTSASAAPRRPVVVELFSSEGCSSCPDADAALDELDRTQPVAGAQVLALELHVDYWNQLGWADPFSSAAFSARQGEYARAMSRDGVYTPQAVIDGTDEVVGSRRRALAERVQAATRRPAAQVALSRVGGRVRVAVSGLPPGADASAEVWLAITERSLATDVPRGENAGRHLAHGPVVRQLQRLGNLRGGAFERELELSLPRGVRPENAQAVVLVQERASRHIVGAGAIELR